LCNNPVQKNFSQSHSVAKVDRRLEVSIEYDEPMMRKLKIGRDEISSLPMTQFRELGIACCQRLAHLTKDNRFAKALKKLEQSVGPPCNEPLRRDAFNAANSAYVDIHHQQNEMTVEAAVFCTLVCASENFASSNLLGNFEFALSKGEFLSLDQIRRIEAEIITGCLG
jgi:hypothetical protein